MKPEPRARISPHGANWIDRPDALGPSLPGDAVESSNNEVLHQILLRAADYGQLPWARHLVYLLVHGRGERPDSRHYHALILANSDPTYGSAADVEQLLEEMEAAQVPIGNDTYYAVLKVGLQRHFVHGLV